MANETDNTARPWLIENNYDGASYYCADLRLTLTFAKPPESAGERQAQQAIISEMATAPALVGALQEIAKGEGAFSRDQLKHATNSIESMKLIALRALNLVTAHTDSRALLDRAAGGK